MLAEAYYRRDAFEKAAASLTGVDVSANRLIVSQYPTLNVAKLRSFQGQTPYEVHGDGQSTRLKLLRTDPLPLVSVRVNGSEEVTFFIDTGASEVTLDTEFARELGVPQFGSVQGTFSGGQNAEVQQGRIEALKVGDWTVRNLPVAMLPLRQLSQGLGAKQIDGVIGTTLFYHFLTTLDVPHGELVLRRKNATNLGQLTASSGQERRGAFLDCRRPFHGGVGSRGVAPACAAVRRHRARGRGSQVGPVRDQASRYQAGTRQSFHRGGRWRKTGDGALRRAPTFIWRRAGKERGRGFTMGRFLGRTSLAFTWRAWWGTISSSHTR